MQRKAPGRRYRHFLAGLALFAITVAVFLPVRDNAFITIDDVDYIVGNRAVAAGLTWRGAVWAFTTSWAANWHPLTWLSHMADVTFFGLDPAGHHLVNVLLHAANSAILFLVVRGLTGAAWSSAFVAALFALHPAQVESVAWAAERKNVLSTLFWILALGAYVRQQRRPHSRAHLAVFGFMLLGLLAKPALVVLPLTLLLLDYWPLDRLKRGATAPFLEKIPLFALAAASATVTLIVQRHGGMVKSMQEYSFPVRWATAVESYVRYIGTILWPRNLVFPTSHPGADISPWGLGSALLLLAAISALALLGRRRWPHLFVGWFWFLATLAPVVGVVQVADQGTADRYLYVPLIGAGMILAWGAPRKPPALARGGVAVGILALGLLVFMTRTQIGFWRDDESLFGHAVRASQGNYLAEFAYGNSLQDRGHLDQAEEHLRLAITLHPQYAEAHNNLGRILRARGRNEEARGHFEEALRIWPGNPQAHNNLGNSLLTEGRKEEAISHYQQAVSLAPTFALAYANLSAALLQSGRIAAAFAAVARALEEDPSLPEGHGNLGAARSLQGDLDGAIDAYGKALELNPDLPNIHLGLAMALERRGRPEEAAFHYREALRLVPGMSQAREALARLAGGAGG